VHQRIRPIVLCLATLLESGGKISSLIKLYKTLREGYQFLWLYIKVDKKFVVSQSQQHLTRYKERLVLSYHGVVIVGHDLQMFGKFVEGIYIF
jgi:hypothetical protein